MKRLVLPVIFCLGVAHAPTLAFGENGNGKPAPAKIVTPEHSTFVEPAAKARAAKTPKAKTPTTKTTAPKTAPESTTTRPATVPPIAPQTSR